MSAESTPILSGAIPAFEMFMTHLEQLSKQPRLKQLVKPGLDWACKYYARMDRTRAYTIAMRKQVRSQSGFQTSNGHIQFLTLPSACHGFTNIGEKNTSELLRLRFWKR